MLAQGSVVPLAETLPGKKIWFGNGCFRCHTGYPRILPPVVKRFRIAHDPKGRDYLPGSIDSQLLVGYQQRLTDSTIEKVVRWSDAAARLLKRGGPYE